MICKRLTFNSTYSCGKKSMLGCGVQSRRWTRVKPQLLECTLCEHVDQVWISRSQVEPRFLWHMDVIAMLAVMERETPGARAWPACWILASVKDSFLFQIHDLLFSFIANTETNIPKYINKYNYWVCIMLVLCVFSQLTIWYWVTNWCAFPWARVFLLLSTFFSSHSYLRMVKASLIFPHPKSPLLLFFRQLCWREIMRVVSDISRKHSLSSSSLLLWFSQSLCLHFHNDPWASGVGVVF